MQEVTPTICGNSYEEETKQLYDIRDAKKYWVAKLADGNCWMVQNLDYDIPESELPGIKRYDEETGVSEWPDPTSDTIPRYYDPGNYYYGDIQSWEYCGQTSNGLADTACIEAGWTKSGNSHYHIGNYYNWYAATQGSWQKATTRYMNASESICPAGWEMPRGGENTNGTFGALSTSYGVENNKYGASSLRKPPLYFIPGGTIRSKALIEAGLAGLYWSSTAFDSGQAYILHFRETSVNTVVGYSMGYAYNIRCLILSS